MRVMVRGTPLPLPVVVGFIASLLTGSTACTTLEENCEGVSCVIPLIVSWRYGELPDDTLVRLCVDDRCGHAQRPAPADVRGAAGFRVTDSAVELTDEEVHVRLELVDASGVPIRTLEGSANPGAGLLQEGVVQAFIGW